MIRFVAVGATLPFMFEDENRAEPFHLDLPEEVPQGDQTNKTDGVGKIHIPLVEVL